MRILSLLVLVVAFPGPATGQGLPSSYPPEADREAYYLRFSEVDSATYATVYPDQPTRDSIRAEHSNYYRGARAVEAHALKQQDIDFLMRVDASDARGEWSIQLTSGRTIRIDPADVGAQAVDLTFENYDRAHELIVFQIHWLEGSDYVLVSRQDGEITRAFGPPVFSPSGRWFVAFNEDILAGYSPNGLQLFQMYREGIREVLTYDLDGSVGGPTRLRWIDDRTFSLEVLEPYRSRGRLSTEAVDYRVHIHRVR